MFLFDLCLKCIGIKRELDLLDWIIVHELLYAFLLLLNWSIITLLLFILLYWCLFLLFLYFLSTVFIFIITVEETTLLGNCSLRHRLLLVMLVG